SVLFGNTLLVTGDANANTVVINDAGNGSISASIDGSTPVGGTAIKNVIVNTRGGNDSVTYNLNGPATSRLYLAVDLRAFQGATANTNAGTFDSHRTTISSTYLTIGVMGTKGTDIVTATNLGGITDSYVTLAAYLGDGNATFDATVTGNIDEY